MLFFTLQLHCNFMALLFKVNSGFLAAVQLRTLKLTYQINI